MSRPPIGWAFWSSAWTVKVDAPLCENVATPNPPPGFVTGTIRLPDPLSLTGGGRVVVGATVVVGAAVVVAAVVVGAAVVVVAASVVVGRLGRRWRGRRRLRRRWRGRRRCSGRRCRRTRQR